jgi:hypothetical protein
MAYKPLAVRVALVAGFRRALPVFNQMIVVVVAVVMWESPQGFPRCVGRVESRLYGFPCFPCTGISTAFWAKLFFALAISVRVPIVREEVQIGKRTQDILPPDRIEWR